MIEYILVFVIGFTLSYAIRLLILYFNGFYLNTKLSGDASGHRIIIDQLKKDWRSKRIENFVMSNDLHYALGFHRLAAIFPSKTLSKKPYLVNLLIYSFFHAAFAVYIYHVSSYLELSISPVLITLLVFLIGSLSVTNLIFVDSSVTFANLSERLLSNISCNFFFFNLYLYMEYHLDFSLVIGGISGGILLITSTFGRQVLMFVLPIIAILTLSWSPVMFFCGSFVIASLLERGYFFKSFVGTIKYWTIYKNNVKKFNYKNVNSLTNPYVIVNDFKNGGLKKVFLHLCKSQPSRIFIFYPEIVVSVVLLFVFPSAVFIKFIIAASLIMVATATYRFAHLGESYRYIEYSLLHTSIFAMAMYLQKLGADILLIGLCAYLFYIACSTIIIRMAYNMEFKGRKMVENDPLNDFISEIDFQPTDLIYTVSARLGLDICARKRCRIYWWQSGGITDQKLYDRYWEQYPFLKTNWRELNKLHPIDYIIVDKKRLKNLRHFNFDVSGLDVVADSDMYIAYKP